MIHSRVQTQLWNTVHKVIAVQSSSLYMCFRNTVFYQTAKAMWWLQIADVGWTFCFCQKLSFHFVPHAENTQKSKLLHK